MVFNIFSLLRVDTSLTNTSMRRCLPTYLVGWAKLISGLSDCEIPTKTLRAEPLMEMSNNSLIVEWLAREDI
jgi:hypothetical protein